MLIIFQNLFVGPTTGPTGGPQQFPREIPTSAQGRGSPQLKGGAIQGPKEERHQGPGGPHQGLGEGTSAAAAAASTAAAVANEAATAAVEAAVAAPTDLTLVELVCFDSWLWSCCFSVLRFALFFLLSFSIV